MLPSTIPIFPLPNVVLFPSVCLPLHIFEPRYRHMLADALSGDRIIGMALQKGGGEPGDGPPPVYDIGCAGLVSHAERLPDDDGDAVLAQIGTAAGGAEVLGQVLQVPGTALDRNAVGP